MECNQIKRQKGKLAGRKTDRHAIIQAGRQAGILAARKELDWQIIR